MSLLSWVVVGGASALGYEQIASRAFVFAGVGTKEKRTAAPHYRRFLRSMGITSKTVEIYATAAGGLPDLESGGER